jgi:hypothetical protein
MTRALTSRGGAYAGECRVPDRGDDDPGPELRLASSPSERAPRALFIESNYRDGRLACWSGIWKSGLKNVVALAVSGSRLSDRGPTSVRSQSWARGAAAQGRLIPIGLRKLRDLRTVMIE